MASKAVEYIKGFINPDDKKTKIIVAIGLIGLVLILASSFFDGKEENDRSDDYKCIDYEDYAENLELKLTDIINSIDGAGECKVMITLENSAENVYATDVETKTDNNSSNQKDKYVFYDSSNGESPVLIKEYLPKVQGVTVLCNGGDNIAVKEKIIQCVTSLFNIPTNRVSVSKIKS